LERVRGSAASLYYCFDSSLRKTEHPKRLCPILCPPCAWKGCYPLLHLGGAPAQVIAKETHFAMESNAEQQFLTLFICRPLWFGTRRPEVRILSPRPSHLVYSKAFDALRAFARRMRPLHRRAHRIRLRMNVPLCGRKIAAPRQIRESIWVHVCRPAREAGVAKGVEVERFQLGERYRLAVLLSQA
jgi:hypothetical protein